MKIERVIYGLAISCLAITPVMSQVDKEVEVTQAFIPQIMDVTKPELMPDIADEAYISPDIDYSITPISIHTELDTTPYKPVEMDYWEYNREKNYYAKLGFGLPTSSIVDLYASKSNTQGYLVGYINHEGNYADIKSDYGVKNSAVGSHLRVGSAAGLYLGERILESNFNYKNDLWSRYATNVESDEHPLYQRLGLDLRYGDNFSDWSSWNYAIDGGLEQMWSRSGFNNTRLESRFDIGKEISEGKILLSGVYDYVGGSNNYSNKIFGASLRYGLDRSRIKFYVGLDYLHESTSFSLLASNVAYSIDSNIGDIRGSKSNLFIPRLGFDYQIVSTQMIGYVALGGEVLNNDFASLSERNPYLIAGLFGAKSTLQNDLSVGVKGTVADKRLGYDISGRYCRVTDQIYWAMEKRVVSYYSLDNNFIANMSDQNSLSLIVSSDYRPNSNLLFELEAQFSSYNNDDDQPWEDGMSSTELRFNGEYKVGAFGLGLNCELLSSRLFSEMNYSSTGRYTLTTAKIPTTFDLGASIDYSLDSGVVLFGDVTNILNDDLYDWVGYRDYGVGFMVGVKFEF